MKKKKKLNLDELKVQSFVTSLNNSNGKTAHLKGGEETDYLTCQASCQIACTEGWVVGMILSVVYHLSAILSLVA